MVGYAKNAPKDEEWLKEKIANLIRYWRNYDTDEMTRQERHTWLTDQILAKMKEGGWVSPVELKDALSREMAAGFRLGLNKSKGGF